MVLTLDTLKASFGLPRYTDPTGTQWFLTDLKGWFSAPARAIRHKVRTTAAGAHRSAAYRGTRNIVLDGMMIPPDEVTGYGFANTVLALCPDPGRLYPLTLTDPSGTLVSYVEQTGEILCARRGGVLLWDFSIPLVASDPRRFSVSWSASSAPASVTGVGGVVSTGSGVVSTGGGVVSGTAPVPPVGTVAAQGTEDNPLVFAITGPASGVTVIDTVGGSIVGYAGNLGAADTVFINCDSQPARDVPGTSGPIPSRGALLGTTSARSAVSVRGGWPVLHPGAVGSYLLGGSYGAGAGLTVYSRGAYA